MLQLWILFWENVQQYLNTAITSKNLKWWLLLKVWGLNAAGLRKSFTEWFLISSNLKEIKNYQTNSRSFVMKFCHNSESHFEKCSEILQFSNHLLHKVMGVNARKVSHSILSLESEIIVTITDPLWLVML